MEHSETKNIAVDSLIPIASEAPASGGISVKNAQSGIRAQYLAHPESAKITDRASTRSDDHSDPFHASVSPMPASGVELTVGVHAALGGPHDSPTPGDILCAAWASCLDSSLRMVANIMGITLESLEVSCEAEVDVRGTLMMERTVPVGFQNLRCHIRMSVTDGTLPEAVDRLCRQAEKSCVVQQTLLSQPTLTTHYESVPNRVSEQY